MLQKTLQTAKKFGICAKETSIKCGKFALEQLKKNVPAAVSLVLTVAALSLTLFCSAHTVNVFDGENTYSAKGDSSNIEAVIDTMAIADREYEIVGVSSSLFSTQVEIEYLIPFSVKMGNEFTSYSVKSGTVSEILAGIGITVDEHDILSLPLDQFIDAPTTLEIIDVEYVTETETEAIPYGSDVVFSSDYDTNTSFVTSGKAGTKTKYYSVKYVNGVKVESSFLKEEVTELAVDKTTVYGTSAPQYAGGATVHASSVPSISTLKEPTDLLLDKNGRPIKYTSKTTLRATAYTHTGNPCSTGVYPQPGHIAVDPKEIPYGTKMYIVSADGKYVYGYAVAADTGGFIYGTHTDVDLFLDSEEQCVQFGRRNIIVYFLD